MQTSERASCQAAIEAGNGLKCHVPPSHLLAALMWQLSLQRSSINSRADAATVAPYTLVSPYSCLAAITHTELQTPTTSSQTCANIADNSPTKMMAKPL